MLFQRFDTNSNGTLERDEIPQQLDKLLKSFKIIDANGDASLSRSEFEKLGQRQSVRRTDEQNISATRRATRPPASSSNNPGRAHGNTWQELH